VSNFGRLVGFEIVQLFDLNEKRFFLEVLETRNPHDTGQIDYGMVAPKAVCDIFLDFIEIF